MGDRLGIQVAVDILPFFTVFIHIRLNKLFPFFVNVHFVIVGVKSSKFAHLKIDSGGPRTVEPLPGDPPESIHHL